MEKRFLSFLLISMAIMIGYGYLQVALFGPPQQADQADLQQADAEPAAAPPIQPVADALTPDSPPPDPAVDADDQVDDADDAATSIAADDTDEDTAVDAADGAVELPTRLITFGSLDQDSRYKMLVYATSMGAAIVRIEFNDPRYQDIENKSGYLGYLALEDVPNGRGCRVGVVGPGTPAALAKADGVETPGLQGPQFGTDEEGKLALRIAGDRILEINGKPVSDSRALRERLNTMRPRQEIELTVERADEGGTLTKLQFQTTLVKRPLAIVRTEPDPDADMPEDNQPHPPSFLMTLSQLGDNEIEFGGDEISGLPSLHRENWLLTPLESDEKDGPGVQFRRRFSPAALEPFGVTGPVEVIKSYRLATIDKTKNDKHDALGYQVQLDVEIRNLGKSAVALGYQMDGPTGLPLEGWWYSSKVHPTRFKAAGARDVVWRLQDQKHLLSACAEITSQAEDDEENPNKPLLSDPAAVRYIGCDSQYFSSVLVPQPKADRPPDAKANFMVDAAFARPVGPLDTERKKRTDVTFRFRTSPETIAAGGSINDRFVIFAGPKHPDVLEPYGLEDCIVYGWFGRVSKPLVGLLHVFYKVVRNYGLAVIMLTVLVRGCMFPLGRKMALNAQKMQMLAPEMKKIAEKYKNDMEKRSQAQRELFSKHNYNPFAGCLLMFFQLPIFIGLYRGLSVDVELRQAPLIPGLTWCSNLAGPDKMLNWSSWLPSMLSDKTGWLGPYLNILPVVTVVLFIVHQKLFTPPPTDDQQKMQHQMMKFMMLFMGVLFHKIAAGLCIYFIASSMWGLAERLLLPKPQLAGAASADGSAGTAADKKEGAKLPFSGLLQTKNGDNGGASAAAKRRKRAKKKR